MADIVRDTVILGSGCAGFAEIAVEHLVFPFHLNAFEGRPLPHVPEIVEEQRKKKRFIFF